MEKTWVDFKSVKSAVSMVSFRQGWVGSSVALTAGALDSSHSSH